MKFLSQEEIAVRQRLADGMHDTCVSRQPDRKDEFDAAFGRLKHGITPMFHDVARMRASDDKPGPHGPKLVAQILKRVEDEAARLDTTLRQIVDPVEAQMNQIRGQIASVARDAAPAPHVFDFIMRKIEAMPVLEAESFVIRQADASVLAALDQIPPQLRRVSDLAMRQARVRVATAADPERARLLADLETYVEGVRMMHGALARLLREFLPERPTVARV